MVALINQLPDDVLRLIFFKVAYPKIGNVCRKWQRLNSDKVMVSFYLQAYEATLGKMLYAQFTQRMHEWEFKSHEGFSRLLRKQWSLITYVKISDRSVNFVKSPLHPERIKMNEIRIAESMEWDLYAFCALLLTKREVHLQDEDFVDGISLLMLKTPHKDRLKSILQDKLGTHFWSLIQKSIDLTVVRELTFDNSLYSIPIQIVHLVGLERLSLPDKHPFYIPADIVKLPHLKSLDLGRNKKHYLAPELLACDQPVIKTAIDSWRKT